MPATLLNPGYEKVTLADRAMSFISTDFRGVAATGNVTAVGGDDCVLVVDSGHFPSLTRRIISEIRGTFKGPVRYLVNTHWHPDHWVGNSLFKDEFPGLVILSHSFTRGMIRKAMLDYPRQMSEQFPVILRDLREAIQTGTRRDGTVLTEEDKRYRLEVSIPDLESFLEEIKEMQVELPNFIFETSLSIDLGGREAKVLHMGRGNTAGDVVVHFPDSGILTTGDLVVAPIPFAFGSYLTEWVEVLKKLRATNAAVLVPGHGHVMRDWKYIEALIGLLESVTNQVRQAVEQNAAIPGNTPLTLDAIRNKVNLEAFEKQLGVGDYFTKLAFPRLFTQPATERAFLEARFAEERGA